MKHKILLFVLLAFMAGVTVLKAQTAPTITGFSPARGPIGSLVTIFGNNLSNPTAFTIGGVTATVISNTGTQLVGRIMPGTAAGTVSVTAAGGTATSSRSFTISSPSYPNKQQGTKLVGTETVGVFGPRADQGRAVSVSADGNTALVGGNAANGGRGGVWMYTRSSAGEWIQQGAKLFSLIGFSGGGQGWSVSLSADGNTALVGAPFGGFGAGVLVYTRSDTGEWTEPGITLVGTGAVGQSSQGYSVSLSADGNTAIVGGHRDNAGIGAAWVFTRSDIGEWTQQGDKLIGTGAVGAAQQGRSVSISADGNTAMVGGFTDNVAIGAVWVYTRLDGVWTQQGAKLIGTGATSAALQGCSVSLSGDGNTALVGGYTDRGLAGSAWVFTRSGSLWAQQGTKLVGTPDFSNDNLGISVSLSADGNTAILGAENDLGDSVLSVRDPLTGLFPRVITGAAYVYTRSGAGTWEQKGTKLVGRGRVGNSHQGSSVALSADGGTAFVGGTGDNDGIGAVWVFVDSASAASINSVVTSFSPSTVVAGDTVTITGINLTDALAVSFGNTAATSFIVVNATTIKAVVGAGGTGKVSVITPEGTASLGGLIYVTKWQGGNGGSWGNTNNWTGGIPTGSLNVLIDEGYPIMDVDFTLPSGKSLTISGTGSLVINVAITLKIAGIANFGDRSVTIKSDESGTGAIGNITGTLTGATNVTIERFIPNNGFRSWRLLSVPTFGSQTIAQSWQQNTLITGSGNGFDAGSSSMLTYDAAGNSWLGVTGTNAAISTNDGYFLYVRGDRSQGTTGAITATNATTLSTTGALYQGNKSTSVPAGKYALVGNAYPSAIDFTKLTLSPEIDNVFYLWDSKKLFGTSLGVYQYFDGDLGYPASIAGGSYATTPGNTTIQSGQAFFVRNSGSGVGTVTLHESSKVAGTGTAGLRPTTPANTIATLYSRLLDASGSNVGDVNIVKIAPSFSNEIDGHDIAKLPNGGENFGIKRMGKTYAIEGRQPISSTDTIFFNTWNLRKQSYKLEFEPNNLAASGFTALLQDSYLNSNTPVDLLATTRVNFTVDANAASSAANRFRLVFRPSAILPVSFISISANRGTTGAIVNWKVAAERAIRQYEVESSVNGRSFSNAGTVPANAATNYSFTDVNASTGTLYYRIKMAGMAGEISYSSIVKLSAGNTKPGFTISPNPVEGSVVNLQFKNQVRGSYSIRLLNTTGQVVFNNIVVHTGGSSNQLLNLPAGIVSGTYQVQIIAPDQSKTIHKLLIISNK